MKTQPAPDAAVSEIVGTIILITVFIAAGAIVMSSVISQPSPLRYPALNVVISNESSVVRLYHAGGDSVPFSELSVKINGATVPFYSDSTDSIWSIGETLTASGTGMPDTVQVISTNPASGQMLLASASVSGRENGTGTIAPTGSPTPVLPPVAGFQGTPTSGMYPLAVVFTDTSTGAPTSWAWDINNDGTVDYTTQNCVHTYPAAGTYSVALTVTNAAGGNTLVRTNYITAFGAAPAVTAVSPDSGYNDTTVMIGNLSGTGFAAGATVRLNATGKPDIAATGVTVVSPTQITCSFALNGAPEGDRNVVVTNPDGQSGMLVAGFSVLKSLPAPSVTSITNVTGYRGWPVVERITGTGFVTGSIPKLNRTGYPDIPAADIVVVSPTRITCTFDLLGKDAGSYNVVVTNPDGKTGMRAGYFTLSSPAPGVSNSPAFSPNTGAKGTTVTITAPGTRLQPGMSIVLARSPTTITAYNVTVKSPTQVVFTVDIPAGATNGAYSATYTNTDGKAGSRTNRFTVTTPAVPVANFTGSPLSGVVPLTVSFTDTSTGSPTSWAWSFGDGGTSTLQSPSHVYLSAGTYTVSLTAANAGGSNTVTKANYITAVATMTPPVAGFTGTPLSGPAPLTVSFTDTSTGSPTSWVWNFGDAGSSTLQNPSHQYITSGTYTVSLTATNVGGSNTATRTGYITVLNPAPAVSAITPGTGSRGSTVSITNLAGTGFQPGATVTFSISGHTVAGASVSVSSPTMITCQFPIPNQGWARGMWDVTVTNPDGQSGTGPGLFTVP